jgi:hypothetical protein
MPESNRQRGARSGWIRRNAQREIPGGSTPTPLGAPKAPSALSPGLLPEPA